MQPVPIVAPREESSGLSAAVAPTPGEACWGEWPGLEADGCTGLLRRVGQNDPASLPSRRLEQAPAQVAQRVEGPEHVLRVWWPASSAELHPVQRLWEDLKRRIDVLDTRVRSSLAALQEHVAGLIHGYTAETIASLTGYAYLVEAIHAL